MKLSTIWTMPAMTLRERFRRTWDEWFLCWLGCKMPKRLSYWAVVNSGAYASSRNPNKAVPDLTFYDVLDAHPGGG